MPGPAPKLNGVLETALYVDDLERAARFYEDVLGLSSIGGDSRFRAYDVAGRNVLLLFKRGATTQTVTLPGGTIPPHDGAGPLHIAFSVSAEDLSVWQERLTQAQTAIEGRTRWPREAKASTFATRMGTCWSLQAPVSGSPTEPPTEIAPKPPLSQPAASPDAGARRFYPA